MRVYTFSIENASVAAALDLFELIAGATADFQLVSINVGFIGTPASQNLRIKVHRPTGSGSGGTSGVAGRPHDDSNTVTAATTCEILNTSQAAAASPAVILKSDTFNIFSGWQWILLPEEKVKVSATNRLVVALDTAPAASTPCNASICVAE